MNYPTISIIIVTLNADRTLESCLKSIRHQVYLQDKVEIIIVDGGSTDKTISIAHKYNSIVIRKNGVTAETAKAYGLRNASGLIVADFGSDNIIPNKFWLKKMIQPLVDNPLLTGSYPLYYTYRKIDTIMNRYVALFGVNDPIPFFLGKADRQSLLYSGYSLAGEVISENKAYYTVQFTKDNLPTVGANGFFIRKSILSKGKISPKKYFHIDVVYDVVEKGYNIFAVVKSSIIHDTGNSLIQLIKKRRRYFRLLYANQIKDRRYHIVGSEDQIKTFFFALYSLTFIIPFITSIRGYFKKNDLAWFMHPIFCFLITLIYVEGTVYLWLKNRR